MSKLGKKRKPDKAASSEDAALEKMRADYKRLTDKKAAGGGGSFSALDPGANRRRFVKSPEDVTYYAEGATHFGVNTQSEDLDGSSNARCANDPELSKAELKAAGYLVKTPSGYKRIGCVFCAKLKAEVAKANAKYPRGSAESKAAYRELMSELGPRKRTFSWVLEPDDKGFSKTPKPFEYGQTIHQPLLQLYLSPDVCGNFVDNREGIPIVITKTGERMDTSYTVSAARKSFPVKGFKDLPSIRTVIGSRYPLITPEQAKECLAMPREDSSAEEAPKKKKKDKSKVRESVKEKSTDKLRKKLKSRSDKNPYKKRR